MIGYNIYIKTKENGKPVIADRKYALTAAQAEEFIHDFCVNHNISSPYIRASVNPGHLWIDFGSHVYFGYLENITLDQNDFKLKFISSRSSVGSWKEFLDAARINTNMR